MEGLDQVINERVSFLEEQINPKNKPLVNRAFEIQIETIRDADAEKVALLILQKKKRLENRNHHSVRDEMAQKMYG